MKLAFCLFKYFPFGGLQRDFKRIAQVCIDRGHSIYVFTMDWQSDIPSGFNVSVFPKQGFTNHRRRWNFSERFKAFFEKERFDAVIGFNKMQGLDVYYAADPCYKAKAIEEKGFFYRFGPRYLLYVRLEEAVFEPSSKTHILLISKNEKAKFIKYYNTPEERFHSLPPGISSDRIPPEGKKEEIRLNIRHKLNVVDDEFLLLMVGSSFKTKGLDRSILALASLPDALRKKTKLFVIGEGKTKPFEKIARTRGVSGQLHFMGGRDDVPRFLLGADLLLHPAYSENTGTVLIEAMAAGLPVLATDVCGYAFHVSKAGAGLLIPSPFKQSLFNEMLKQMLTLTERDMWGRNGLDYTSRTDIFSMPEKAADIIESIAAKRRTCS